MKYNLILVFTCLIIFSHNVYSGKYSNRSNTLYLFSIDVPVTDTIVCKGDTVTIPAFISGNPPVSFIVEHNNNFDTIFSPTNHLQLKLITPGNYNIIGFTDNQQIFQDTSITVSVEYYAPPRFKIYGLSEVCHYSEVAYYAELYPGHTYEWNIPDGAEMIEGSVSANFFGLKWIESGTHTINLTVEQIESECQSGQVSFDVTVYPKPDVKTDYDTIACYEVENSLELRASTIPENKIFWPHSGDTSHTTFITEPGTYSYQEITPIGCSAEGSFIVYNVCVPEVHVPEAFTPNGDKINDELIIYGIHFNMVIRFYNIHGELLYTMNENDPPWSGEIAGQPLPNGTYYWIAYFEDKFGNPYSQEGKVTLIR